MSNNNSKQWRLDKSYDIFSTYFEFVSDTEPPINFHRWCLLGSLAALMGRNVFVSHGHFRVYPNLYITLLGEPASRKSTSIKIIKRLLRSAGYETFAADKTSKEKFLLDLEGHIEPGDGYEITVKNPKYDAISSENLWGKSTGFEEPREVFIAADEFSEFTGTGNLEFYTTLGNLWDWDDPEKPFVQRLKNSRSVSIYQPTINILSGTTAELFSKIFPAESIGSGFLSRLLLIYGERSGRSIAFPRPPDVEIEKTLISYFSYIRTVRNGEIRLQQTARQFLTEIYGESKEIADVRFKAYSNRRFTQLLKLALIISVARFQLEISAETVVEANSILTHAEFLMPKALGEFGKSKHGDVSSKIMGRLEAANSPVTTKELWTYVSRDLDKQLHMMEILQGLQAADKIQVVRVPGKVGYLPKKQIMQIPKFVDWSLLSQEERDLAGILPANVVKIKKEV